MRWKNASCYQRSTLRPPWTISQALTIHRDGDAKPGAVKMVRKILKTTMDLPDRIQAICWVQFWAWIGMRTFSESVENRRINWEQAGSPSYSIVRHGSARFISATRSMCP